MSTTKRGGAFFSTMVLMGSSVAMGSSVTAGCGGMTEAPASGGTNSGGGSDEPGTGGRATGGRATGGGSSTGSGGLAAGTGGSIIDPLETGGSTGTGGELGFGGAGPGDCELYQLVCPEQGLYTCSSQHLVLPSFCECDPDRPNSADDCGDGQSLVCLGAAETQAGEELNPVLPYNCECVQTEYDSCWEACSKHSGIGYATTYCDDPGEISPDLDAHLCGCAVTILK